MVSASDGFMLRLAHHEYQDQRHFNKICHVFIRRWLGLLIKHIITQPRIYPNHIGGRSIFSNVSLKAQKIKKKSPRLPLYTLNNSNFPLLVYLKICIFDIGKKM